MPHWSLPEPPSNTPTSQVVAAIAALQTQVDGLLDAPAGLTAADVDTVEGHLTAFMTEARQHLKEAKANLAG